LVKCLYLSIYLVYQLRSFIEISRSAILKNIKILKTFDVCIYAVVKNNAYGHGMKQIVSILQKTDLDTVCLSHNEEVFQLYKIGWDRRIILFSAIIDSSLFSILKIYPKIELFVYSIDFLKRLIEFVTRNCVSINIHLKIDTGMHRLGIMPDELELAVELIQNNRLIKVIGVATHLHDSSRYDCKHIMKQIGVFDKYLSIIRSVFPNVSTSVCPSGAIDFNIYDAIRCGASLYGIWKSLDQMRRFRNKGVNCEYKQVLSWKTYIMQIKNVFEGKHVGYGVNNVAIHDMRVAIIPVGYADGYPFSYVSDSKGIVKIKGKIYRMFGMLSMNHSIIDITGIDRVEEGDEVTLIDGKNDVMGILNLAKHAGITSTQMTSCLSPFIKRIIVD
jgi:alanine racemase